MGPVGKLLGLALASACLAAAAIGQRAPHIGAIQPAGGKVGTRFDVVVRGQGLRGVTAALVSGDGIRAEVRGSVRPLSNREAGALREQVAALQKRKNEASRDRRRGQDRGRGKGWSDEDEAELRGIRAKLADSARRQEVPAIADSVLLEVAIDRDAALGRRELRLVGPAGGSNPLVFCVDDFPEVVEHDADRPRGRDRRGGRDRGPDDGVPEFALPAILNGTILPGEVDRYRFRGRRGTRLVVTVLARELVPYLADAVPGWFQAVACLRDADGKELLRVDDWRFHPDPVLLCELPADGDYVLELRDAIYRGREDFVYRVAIGALPFVTSAYPLGGPADEPTRVALQGWNLRARNLTVPPAEPDGAAVRIAGRAGGTVADAVGFVHDRSEASAEREAGDRSPVPELVALPALVDGRIDRPGDVDLYSFTGRSGDHVVAELQARRLGSPVDGYLRLLDEGGRTVATADDHVDRGEGLLTHHADPRLELWLPADGRYILEVRDVQGQGGPDHGYRLRIGPPRPDFELRIVPSCINVRAGGTAEVTVHVLRRDGFDGAVDLELRGAPPGLRLEGDRVPAGADSVVLKLSAGGQRPAQPTRLAVLGSARIGQAQVRRAAVPADDEMQAFLWRHLVPAQELVLVVAGRAVARPVRRSAKQTDEQTEKKGDRND